MKKLVLPPPDSPLFINYYLGNIEIKNRGSPKDHKHTRLYSVEKGCRQKDGDCLKHQATQGSPAHITFQLHSVHITVLSRQVAAECQHHCTYMSLNQHMIHSPPPRIVSLHHKCVNDWLF